MKSNARTTIEGSILTAIANTALETGLVAGKGMEVLASEVLKQIFDKSVLWSVEEYARELRNKETSVE